MMLQSFHRRVKSFLNPQQDRLKPPNRVLKMGHEASRLASTRSNPQCMTEMNKPPFLYSDHPKPDTTLHHQGFPRKPRNLARSPHRTREATKCGLSTFHYITSQHIPKIHSSWHVTSHSKPHQINQDPQKPKTPYQLRLPHAFVHHSNPNPYPSNRDLLQALNNLYNPTPPNSQTT